MNWVLLLSLSCGLLAVIQAGINRQISAHSGLPWAVLLNNSVIFLLGLGLFFLARFFSPETPTMLRTFRWWYLLPGVCGLCLVSGIPFSISRVGALATFLAVVGGQMLGTLLWDRSVEGIPLTSTRLLGALLACAGVFLCYWKK